jgi:hypothetical protein
MCIIWHVAIYNPLDKANLGASVANALLQAPINPLPPSTSFDGAGVYAIYYTGPLQLYKKLTKQSENRLERPIYVGKAVPAGARKGGFGLTANPGKVLFARLRQHADSISATADLDIRQFKCRYLVTDDIWIPLGESLLIERFQPVWNKLIEGFGNHTPGKNRASGLRSLWDTLHPGRRWAESATARKETYSDLAKLVEKFLTDPGSVKTISTKKAVEEDS